MEMCRGQLSQDDFFCPVQGWSVPHIAMQLVHAAISADPALPEIAIPVERRQLAKRLWRATAADGAEFGFELDGPLAHGDVVHATKATRYVIRQMPEPVLEIPLPAAPDAAAVTGWAVGNLHFPIEAQPGRLLAPDDTALRQSLDRIGIAYRAIDEVFRPHRLATGAEPHSHAAGPEAHPFVFKPVISRA
jgi:urease accessory protein